VRLLIVSAAPEAAVAPMTDTEFTATPATVPVNSATDVTGNFWTCCAVHKDDICIKLCLK